MATIIAKFPGTCASCRCAIKAGDKIEWQKGAPSRHVVCPAGGQPPVNANRTAPPRQARSGWRPCGYPGCSPSYCDECDGEGNTNRYYGR